MTVPYALLAKDGSKIQGHGDVMSKQILIERQIFKDPMSGCWLWTGPITDRGYGVLWNGGRTLAHRASWEEFVGNIPSDICVLHRCDVPCCVNPTHLFLGTKADNNKDRDKKNRGKTPRLFGSEHPNSMFSESEIVEIRKRLADGESVKQISMNKGCSIGAIYDIRSRRYWAHV